MGGVKSLGAGLGKRGREGGREGRGDRRLMCENQISTTYGHNKNSKENLIRLIPSSLPPFLFTWSKYTLSQCAWHTRSVNKGRHLDEVRVEVTPESISRNKRTRTSISSGMAEA